MSKPKRELHIRHDLSRARNSGVARSLGKRKKSEEDSSGTLPGGLRLTTPGQAAPSEDSRFALDLRERAAAAAARRRRTEHSAGMTGSLAQADRLIYAELVQALREHTDTLREVHGLAPLERETTGGEGDEDEPEAEEALEDAAEEASEPESAAS